jgi:hypothetical protein
VIGKAQSAENNVRLLIWITLAIITLQVAALIAAQTYLFGDGVVYLYSVLDTSRPITWAFSRQFANLVTQMPVAFAIQSGVRDVGVLSYLLGAGLYLPLVVSLAFCAWIARDRLELMLFPLLSAAAVSSSSDFFIISESSVLIVFFWPALFLLSLRREWAVGDFVLAWMFAIPTLLCYESMAFFGPVLTGVALWRAGEALRAGDQPRAIGFVALAVYFAAGVLIAAWWIVHPKVVNNFHGFLEATRFYRDSQGHVHWLGLLSLLSLVLVGASFLFRSWPKLFGSVAIVAFAIMCGIAALAPVLWPSSLSPVLHARARVLNAYIPPLLGVAFLLALRNPPSYQRWKYAFLVVAILAAAQGVWHVLAAQRWAAYLNTFRAEVATREGLVPFEQSVLSHELVNGYPVAALTSRWTMPTMSIMMSPGGRVQAMIQNPDPESWQPFRPEHPEKLPDLRRYGITYDAYALALKR